MSDRLSDVRPAVRARALHDFAFFCTRVLGVEDVQDNPRALRAWDAVQRGVRIQAPSDTFRWIFSELCL